jgi:ketosteroid isomerase-like protein
VSTTEVVLKYYACVNAGDWDQWLTLFDENLVMDEQLMGHVEGLDALRGVAAGLKSGFNKFLMFPQHVVVEGDEAAVIWKFEAETAKGAPINANGANFFRVENGKITYMSNFHDTKPFAPLTEQ